MTLYASQTAAYELGKLMVSLGICARFRVVADGNGYALTMFDKRNTRIVV